MFDRILIANRGEIAVRVARTCARMGVSTVAVYSDVDASARHVATADDSVHLPGRSATDTYLRAAAVIEAATSSGAQAIHPGYGFLSESAAFAAAVADAGLVWIGPPASAIEAVGDKVSARRLVVGAGVPVVPGLTDPVTSPDEVSEFAATHGFPLAIKAAGGGGGRGMRIVTGPEEIADALASAQREAQAYFGSDVVYIERYLAAPKHVEIQLLAPGSTDALWLGARDCSLQRRHQKLVEETPPPRGAGRVADMGAAAVALAKACGYVNAGTCEFLMEGDDFYFLEVNARLQVEHTVTEEVLGLDLVECQLKIAAGEPLGLDQNDVIARTRGHSIECRINAEDPARSFLPSPGTITAYREPAGDGVRVDSGYASGDAIPEEYDSLIAKLIVTAPDREAARLQMIEALGSFVIEGVATTIPAHLALLAEPSFIAGDHSTVTVEASGVLDALVPDGAIEDDVLLVAGKPVRLWNPAMAAAATSAVHAGRAVSGEVAAPMQGTILKVLVAAGDEVEAGDPLMVLEAMKMETTIAAPKAGKVAAVHASGGMGVAAGAVLVTLE